MEGISVAEEKEDDNKQCEKKLGKKNGNEKRYKRGKRKIDRGKKREIVIRKNNRQV